MIFYILLAISLVLLFISIREEWLDQKAKYKRQTKSLYATDEEREPWGWRKLDKVVTLLFPTILWAVITAVVLGLYAFGVWTTVWAQGTHYKTGTENQNLAALDLGNSREAHGSVIGVPFFLIGSYDSEGTKKLNYLADVTGDGGFAPQSLDGSDAIIYQGVSSPHLTIVHYDAADYSGFWLPGDVVAKDVDSQHLFYVPEGSIQTKFDVDISK